MENTQVTLNLQMALSNLLESFEAVFSIVGSAGNLDLGLIGAKQELGLIRL